MPVVIEEATAGDVPHAAAVLAEAFRHDPRMPQVFTGQDDFVPTLTRVFELQMKDHYIPDGFVDLAFDDDVLAGVAMWAPPGRWQMSYLSYLCLAPAYVSTLRTSLLSAVRSQLDTESVHPRLPHWYLYAIGALTPGRGIGHRLLEYRLARAGPEAAYLEASTPASARLYARHGFRSMGLVPGSTKDVPVYAMWRGANDVGVDPAGALHSVDAGTRS